MVRAINEGPESDDPVIRKVYRELHSYAEEVRDQNFGFNNIELFYSLHRQGLPCLHCLEAGMIALHHGLSILDRSYVNIKRFRDGAAACDRNEGVLPGVPEEAMVAWFLPLSDEVLRAGFYAQASAVIRALDEISEAVRRLGPEEISRRQAQLNALLSVPTEGGS